LDFKNILTQEFFYQKANLSQLTAKSEKVEFFGGTLVDSHATSNPAISDVKRGKKKRIKTESLSNN